MTRGKRGRSVVSEQIDNRQMGMASLADHRVKELSSSPLLTSQESGSIYMKVAQKIEKIKMDQQAQSCGKFHTVFLESSSMPKLGQGQMTNCSRKFTFTFIQPVGRTRSDTGTGQMILRSLTFLYLFMSCEKYLKTMLVTVLQGNRRKTYTVTSELSASQCSVDNPNAGTSNLCSRSSHQKFLSHPQGSSWKNYSHGHARIPKPRGQVASASPGRKILHLVMFFYKNL